jgi:hypothetical protein
LEAAGGQAVPGKATDKSKKIEKPC